MQKKIRIITISLIIALFALLMVVLSQRKTSSLSQINDLTSKATVYTKIGEQELDITNLIDQNPTAKISAGMIPVKYDGNYWVITTFDDNTWYDYASGKPAYMMLNDGVYQSEEYYKMSKDKKIAKDNVGTQIANDDLGSIYMWVPRFAYTEDEDAANKIIYIKNECIVDGSYIMPNIFSYTIGTTELSLSGLWVEISELESSSEASTKNTNLNMGEQDTTYGFLSYIRANVMTEDEKVAMQKYIENLNTHAQIITTNHTVIKVLEETQAEPIKANVTSSSATGIATVNVTYAKNNIVKILDDEGNELEKEIVNNQIIAQSQPQNNGMRNFYIIDNKGNIKRVCTEITGTLIVASTEFNGNDLEITITVTSSRFDISQIVYSKKNNDVKNIVLSENSTTATLTKTINGIYEFKVFDIKGNYITLTKEVSGLSIYIIETYDDLKDFRDDVNNGLTNYDTKAYQIADVVIPENNWVPIGSNVKTGSTSTSYKRFNGCYDGQGYSITINSNGGDSEYYGLFGYAEGKSKDNPVVIKNLKVCGSIKGGKIVGGIVGNAQYATITNCSNSCKITVSTTISNATGMVGGIVGKVATSTINGCCNFEDIIVNGSATSFNVGGILGINGTGTKISNCYNTRDITCTGGNSNGSVGGIVGDSQQVNSDIWNCYNLGKISGVGNTAGICGKLVSSNSISCCFNYGDIYSTKSVAAGISAQKSSSTTSYCFNMGNVTSDGDYSFGIVKGNDSEVISYCYNAGKIESSVKDAGGISYRGVVNYCYNTGEITSAKSSAGGISAYGDKISYSFNTGTVTGYNRAGGIATGTTTTVVNYCFNRGNISTTGATTNGGYSGGILGYGSSKVNYCYNTGNVTNQSRSGGISGYASQYTYCYNIGYISGDRAGGICAYNGTASSCYYLEGRVTASKDSYLNRIGTETSREDLINSVKNFSNFKEDIGINDGYPILSWQTENDEFTYDELELINGDSAFVADINNINNGYPILAWQLEE